MSVEDVAKTFPRGLDDILASIKDADTLSAAFEIILPLASDPEMLARWISIRNESVKSLGGQSVPNPKLN